MSINHYRKVIAFSLSHSQDNIYCDKEDPAVRLVSGIVGLLRRMTLLFFPPDLRLQERVVNISKKNDIFYVNSSLRIISYSNT